LAGRVSDCGGLSINNYRDVVQEGNLVVGYGQPRPTDAPARVVVRPSRYDPQRAHVIIFNWTKTAEVSVRPEGFLKAGDIFRLLNPCDVHGKPVVEGQSSDGSFNVPIPGEFAAFVLLKGS